MKKLLLLLAVLVIGLQLQAQSTETAPTLAKKGLNALNRFSVTATVGTPSFSPEELKTLTFNKLSQVSLGDLNISYKVNPRMSFGIGTMGSLSNGASGYYNAENKFTSFCDDDDDHDGDLDDNDHDGLEDDDDDDDDCDEDEIGQNLMSSATYKLSEKFPFFVQAAGGYSFSDKAPAYTALVGYHQKLFAGFGIMAGIRFSDVLHQRPADAVKMVSPDGLKAELGLNWNF